MIKDEKYIIKLEKYVGGKKMEERVLKEFMSSEILGILDDCEISRKITHQIPMYTDDQNRAVEDSIYYGATYSTSI